MKITRNFAKYYLPDSDIVANQPALSIQPAGIPEIAMMGLAVLPLHHIQRGQGQREHGFFLRVKALANRFFRRLPRRSTV